MPLNLPPGDGPPSFPDLLTAAGYRAMAAGLRLGAFAALAGGPLAGPDLAAKLGTDPRGTALLADALVAFGYLEHGPDGYANTAMTAKWLSDDGYSQVDRFWSTVLFESWGELEQSVRTGRPALDFYRWLADRPETLARFQGMLSGMASSIVPEAVELVPVGDRLLDVGGGHAKYSIGLCAAHPGLRATVVDLPDALAVGGRAVAEAGLADRITLREGDYDEIDLGTGYDTALLFNVVHGRTAEANRALLERVAAALNPGGAVVLLEPDEHSDDQATDVFARVFSLNLFHGQGGQVYAAEEIGSWLADTGFHGTTTHPLRSMPGQSLIVARTSA
ncbi:methyltransferase [Actinosynnema sp. NPDC047251]|uniref:Putative methyltransferase n=1 Tax=Saccharothrix espanaensis (strain ATCC 51144 / DSM 44229 / JCM 9112 / NBRC 15066 / NRRL 15764) TaxID=1179773 RepID=K0K2Q4_SACES|nr:methyltransferase [Saccharothrix espanaensis]CCH30853.1 putative methyltransferase [Saccharothrix espanaensis DSM 44229]